MRIDCSGSDVVEGDAIASEFLCEIADEVGLGFLERGVHREIWIVVFFLYAADGDDSAPGLFPHGGQRQLDQLEGRLEVGRELEIDFICVDLQEFASELYRCIGYEDVYVAGFFGGFLVERLRGSWLGEVLWAVPGLLSCRLQGVDGCLSGRLVLDAIEDDVGSRFSERFRYGETDADGRTGDEGSATGEVEGKRTGGHGKWDGLSVGMMKRACDARE